jgi:hypothetical protein
LLEGGSWLLATINIIASLLLGLLAVRAGIAITKLWLA